MHHQNDLHESSRLEPTIAEPERKIHLLAPFLALALTVLTAGCSSPVQDTGAAPESPEQTVADQQSGLEVRDADAADLQDPAVAARDYSLGYCAVSMQAQGDCAEFRGKRASGVAPGCQHQDCTEAKQVARANLLLGIPPACGAYIQCGEPCRCIKKSEAEALSMQESP